MATTIHTVTMEGKSIVRDLRYEGPDDKLASFTRIEAFVNRISKGDAIRVITPEGGVVFVLTKHDSAGAR